VIRGAGDAGVNIGLPGAEAAQVVALAHAYGEPVDATVARAIRALADLSEVKGRRRPVRVPMPDGEVLTVWASRSQRRRALQLVGVAMVAAGIVLLIKMW
jgi:hypothetical protein